MATPTTLNLDERIAEDLDALIDGKTYAANGQLYDAEDHGTPAYTRNTDVWCASLPITCVSVWNDRAAEKRGATLISPRHVIMADHFALLAGDVLRFVAADNTVVERTVDNVESTGVAGSPDFAIGYLTADVPATITPCKFMPTGSLSDDTYFGAHADNKGLVEIPSLGFNQAHDALVMSFGYLWGSNNNIFITDNEDATRELFFKNIVNFDSGQPVFFVINDELVLLTTWLLGGSEAVPGGGGHNSEKAAFQTLIQASMDNTAVIAGDVATHEMLFVDLSEFWETSMTDLCLTYAEITDLVETFKGWTAPSATEQAWALDRVNEGIRQFLRAQYYDERGTLCTHTWSFLQPTSNLTVTKGTSTADGVPADAGGGTTTVDVDDAIFNSTMVGAQVVFAATGNAYIIATFTDTTTVVVTGDATGEADEDTVTVVPFSLALPDNYGGLVQPAEYLFDGGTLYDLYELKPEALARLAQDDQTASTPEYYAILPVEVPTSTTIQKWKIVLHPTPDAAKTLGYRYRVRVDRAEDNVNMPPGGSDFCDVIVECARAAAEYKSGGKTTGKQRQRANAAIMEAAKLDMELYGEAPQKHVQFSEESMTGARGRHYG